MPSASNWMRCRPVSARAALAEDNGTRLDDGLNANERSLKSELKQEKDAKQAKDVVLEESAHLLFDAVGAINASPQLAAEVLPYGGKFTTANVSTGPTVPAVSPQH